MAALQDQWQLTATALQYLPVGFGGYHWLATDQAGSRWFVTVNEISAADSGHARTDFIAAMETAASLASSGMNFVVAPTRSRTGDAAGWLRPEHAVTVFAYADGASSTFDDTLTAAEKSTLIGMLAALHNARSAVGAGPAPVRNMQLAERQLLDNSIRERGRPWHSGPYAEPARALLEDYWHGLVRALAEFDGLIAAVGSDGRDLVITHGEPHPGNIIRSKAGLLLVDWDTVGLAPPERDLWWVLSDHDKESGRYTEQTGREVSRDALALYRLRWTLDDISLFLAEFQKPHRRSPDTEVSFAGLRDGLISLAGDRACSR